MKINNFYQLNKRDKGELFHIYFFIWQTRIRLWLTDYKSTEQWCRYHSKKKSVHSISKENLLKFTNAVSRYVPKATCLTKALVTKTMLDRHDYTNNLIIGVKIDAEKEFEAHAWIEDEKQNIIFGGDSSSDFKPIWIRK